MTREEAISLLTQINKILINNNSWLESTHEPLNIAFTMAIKALEQELSDDCVSRIDVKKQMLKYGFHAPDMTVTEFVEDCLSPVTPQPKIGHWITQWNVTHQKEYYYCSECREKFSYDGETGIEMNNYDFCPNCGTRMDEGSEEEI